MVLQHQTRAPLMPGLAATFETLAQTLNEAAVPVLLRAIDVPDRYIRDNALRTLLKRSSLEAELAMLRRWHTLSDHCRQLIAERPGWISGAIRQGIVGNDDQLHANACAAAIATHEYDLIPLFAEVTCDPGNRFSSATAATVLQLAEELHGLLQSPRDYSERRDPTYIRAYVLPPLERALHKAPTAHQAALTEAFLLVAGREHAGLKRLLDQTDQTLPRQILRILQTSSRAGILQLLVGSLEDTHLPQTVREIYTSRQDLSFLRKLFRQIGDNPSKSVRFNLKRMTRFSWQHADSSVLQALNEQEQVGAVTCIALSGVEREEAFEFVAQVLRQGSPLARRSAVTWLEEFRSPMADEMALLAAHDQDLEVRARVAPQLRQRNISGGIQRLLEMVESPHEVEREAARQSLDEFRYENLREVFATLPPAVQRTLAILVKRIDTRTMSLLAADLESPHRQQRRLAMELAIAMGVTSVVHEALVQLLDDEDEFLRADAVRALAAAPGTETRAALRAKLTDTSNLVRHAAEEALRQQAQQSGSPLSFAQLPEGGSAAYGSASNASWGGR